MAGRKQGKKELFWGWVFFAPTLLGLLILNIIPIFQTIYKSFFQTGAFGRGDRFVGFANYVQMFSDSQVWQSLLNTFVYAIIEVPISIAISLVLAALLNRKMKGRSIYRTIYFLPMVAAPAAVAMVWRWLYNSEFGLLNHMLKSIGLGPVNWISNPDIALISVAIVGIWSVIGYNMVLFLAGLQEIPGDYYEAAEIDGAGRIRKMVNITLPSISTTIVTMLILRLGKVMNVGYEKIILLYNPVIYDTSDVISSYVYRMGFDNQNWSYSAAVGLFNSVINLILLFTTNTISKRLSDASLW